MDILIIADDISGAADCAIAFARTGQRTVVALQPSAPEADVILAVDADTRRLPAAEAARRTREVYEASRRQGQKLYKKIDSTLRGHLGVELRAMLSRAPRPTTVVLTPAFPRQGRALVDGRLCVRGAFVDGPPLASSLAAALGPDVEVLAAGAGAHLEALLSPPPRHRVLVADARDESDLAALAGAALGVRPLPWFVGSAGLARTLAGSPPRVVGEAPGPALVAVGSFSPVARAQVAAVRGRDPAAVFEMKAGIAGTVRSRLERGDPALVHLPFAEVDAGTASRDAVHVLGAALRPLVAACGSLVATGGDTARALLEALGAGSLVVEGEREPGIPVCSTSGDRHRVVLKAGAFGDNEVLLRLMGYR